VDREYSRRTRLIERRRRVLEMQRHIHLTVLACLCVASLLLYNYVVGTMKLGRGPTLGDIMEHASSEKMARQKQSAELEHIRKLVELQNASVEKLATLGDIMEHADSEKMARQKQSAELEHIRKLVELQSASVEKLARTQDSLVEALGHVRHALGSKHAHDDGTQHASPTPSGKQETGSETARTSPSPPAEARTRLGDGCYHVFIDAGSNRGVHGRFLFEPEQYPNNGISPIFDQVFGIDRRSMAICVFAFEPNSYHVRRQTATHRAYKSMGWRYDFINKGVHTETTTLKFYANPRTNDGAKNEFFGFSAGQLSGERDDRQNPPVLVPVIDFSAWLDEHILARTIPPGMYKNPTKPSIRLPSIMIKMDIEGMEVPVLHKLIRNKQACRLTKVIGEWHGAFARQEVAAMNRTLEQLRCRVRFEAKDSEKYLHDGKPYPQPTKLAA